MLFVIRTFVIGVGEFAELPYSHTIAVSVVTTVL